MAGKKNLVRVTDRVRNFFLYPNGEWRTWVMEGRDRRVVVESRLRRRGIAAVIGALGLLTLATCSGDDEADRDAADLSSAAVTSGATVVEPYIEVMGNVVAVQHKAWYARQWAFWDFNTEQRCTVYDWARTPAYCVPLSELDSPAGMHAIADMHIELTSGDAPRLEADAITVMGNTVSVYYNDTMIMEQYWDFEAQNLIVRYGTDRKTMNETAFDDLTERGRDTMRRMRGHVPGLAPAAGRPGASGPVLQ